MLIHQTDHSIGGHTFHTIRFQDRSFRLHFHRRYELIHMMEGMIELTVAGRKERLEAGDFAMILSNEVHQIQSVGHSRYWICTFSGDFVPDFDRAIQGKTGTGSRFRCDDSIYAFLQKHVLFSRKLDGRRHDQYKLTAGLYALCSDWLSSVQLVERDNTQYVLMNTVSDYINRNYQRSLTLKDVAAALGYDYNYFSRLFHRTFGVSFKAYLNECRCSAAAEAIRTTDKSITNIAMDSGFQSIRTFNDVFQRYMGMSPAQYRKQHSLSNII